MRTTLTYPRLIAIGTQTPPHKYTQSELLTLFGITDKKINRIFSHSHIKSRYLCLPSPNPDGSMPDESQAELLRKHRRVALAIGQAAIRKALKKAGLTLRNIDYIAVVSTTGLLCPSLTAHYIKTLGMRPDIQRIDIRVVPFDNLLIFRIFLSSICQLRGQRTGLLRKLIDS